MSFFQTNQFTRYLFTNWDRVWPHFAEHMGIVGKSMLIALVIALPLGFFLSRKRGAATPVLIFLGILYTIPSFALLAFLVPFTGIGEQPAIIALTMYALVVLVRNTMVAFSGVDPDIIEAAQGMGMSGVQQVWKVEIPLALPVIVAGIRISTLSTISLTTIAAWIGAGGLGQLLKDGMSDPTYSKLWAGVICVAALAIASDLVLRWVERLVAVPTAKTRRVPTLQSTQPIIADMAQPKEA